MRWNWNCDFLKQRLGEVVTEMLTASRSSSLSQTTPATQSYQNANRNKIENAEQQSLTEEEEDKEEALDEALAVKTVLEMGYPESTLQPQSSIAMTGTLLIIFICENILLYGK